MPQRENITLTCKAGTRLFLKQLQDRTGITKEQLLQIGLDSLKSEAIRRHKKRTSLLGRIRNIFPASNPPAANP